MTVTVHGTRNGRTVAQSYTYGQWTNLSDAVARARDGAKRQGITVGSVRVS